MIQFITINEEWYIWKRFCIGYGHSHLFCPLNHYVISLARIFQF